MNLYKDNFAEVFTDEETLTARVKEMEEVTTWTPGVTTSTLTVSPISGPIEAAEVARRTGTSEDAAYETSEETGSQLLLKYGGQEHLVRTSALASIFNAAKISGSALGRLGAYKLSEVLNLCFSVAKGSSLIMHRAEKVGAVHSDNVNGYKIMPVPELLEATHDAFSNFGTAQFKTGYACHESVGATWYLPDKQEEFMEAYQKAVKDTVTRIFSANFTPAVMFTTSDISEGSATLIPHFVTAGGGYFALSDPIRVAHRRGAQEGVDLFRLKADELFPTFMAMKDNVERLSSVVIEHPQNAFIGLCNKADIPKKVASPALEVFLQYLNGDDDCCMGLDLYIGISEAMAYAKDYSGEQKLKLMEKISKILRYNMEDYDVAGIVAWSSKQQ